MTHSKRARNPTGGATPGREVTKPALDLELMERVVERENMRRAWKRVKANRGAAGIDGMTLEAVETWMRMHWPTVRESLLAGTYQPLPLRRKVIPKRSGGERLLGIPDGCRSGPGSIFRPRSARCLDGARGSEGDRLAGALALRPVPAGRRDGRGRGPADGVGHPARGAAVSVAREHPARRPRQRA